MRDYYSKRFRKTTVIKNIQDFEVKEIQDQLNDQEKNILKIPYTMSETRSSIEKLNLKASQEPLGTSAPLLKFIH